CRSATYARRPANAIASEIAQKAATYRVIADLRFEEREHRLAKPGQVEWLGDGGVGAKIPRDLEALALAAERAGNRHDLHVRMMRADLDDRLDAFFVRHHQVE